MSLDAAKVVGTLLRSVVKLFPLGGKVDRRVSAGDLDQVNGLITCERGLFSHSAKPATAPGIDAGDPRFRLQFVKKSRTTLRQAQEVATRHEMEE